MNMLLERLVGVEAGDCSLPYSRHGSLHEQADSQMEEKDETEAVAIVDPYTRLLSKTGFLTANGSVLRVLVSRSSETLGR